MVCPMTKEQTPWMKHLQKVFLELRAKDPTVKLKDAMKVAKESYKK